MATRIEAAVAHAPAADLRLVRQAALWGLLGAKMLGGLGVQWDIRWHLLIGRDSFWIAPHLMTYAGVTIAAALAFGVLGLETLRARRGEPRRDGVRALGLVGTPGFHLAWWGMALTIVAAPVDDLWHRLFGVDVTLWSPPHLLGLAGAQVNTLGCLLIALELWPRESRVRRAAFLAGGTLLLAAFYITVDPAIQTAFRRGGLFFFAWPMLGTLAFGFTLALTSRLAPLRATPLVLALGALALHYVGIAVADAGFALTQPTPAIEETIANHPDSPIAIAHEMARRNAARPGRSVSLRVFPLLPAALMALVDARRRPHAAALAFGLGLLVVSGMMFAGTPALNHALPTTTDLVAAAALTALAALTAAAAARILVDRFGQARSPVRARPGA